MTTKTKVARLFIAQDGLCFHCDKPMEKAPGTQQAPLGWTREHLRPRSKGGGNGRNVVLAHRGCNCRRGNREPTQAMFIKAKAIHVRLRDIQITREIGT